MKKLFISQPMANKSEDEIRVERDSALVYAEYNLGGDFEEIDSFLKITLMSFFLEIKTLLLC